MNDNSGSKKTPNRGWFGKGSSSPNPGGRPTASPTPQPSVFEILVDKTLTVVRDGMPKGKPMAMREVAKWILKRDAWLTKHRRQASPPAITRHISPDPDNADAALLLLGIAAPNPARAEYTHNRAQLLLEPWSVQAAIHRRRGGQRLTDRERAEIRRCTRDPDCIRWPRGTDE